QSPSTGTGALNTSRRMRRAPGYKPPRWPTGTPPSSGARRDRNRAAATEKGYVSMSLFDELPTQDRQTFARWLMESEHVEVLATHPSGGTAYEFERFDATMQALEHP